MNNNFEFPREEKLSSQENRCGQTSTRRNIYAKILSVCIAYYASDLERKRSVYERDVDLVLFLATIMATIIATMFVEREENLAALFAGILAIYAMFDDFRRYKRKKERFTAFTMKLLSRDIRNYDNRGVNVLFS